MVSHTSCTARWTTNAKSVLLAASAISMAVCCGTALAWGSDGHKTVALIADSKLTPKARIEVERLLALEPGASLASISTWADEQRNPATAPWHYINFPRESCVYEQKRDCPAGRCVVGAIENQLAVLASNESPESRLMSLKYVVHFVGDVHQPLHAGYLDDKGGNTYQLQAFMRGTNLHALWDSGLIRNLNEDAVTLSARLLKKPIPPNATDLNAARAAEESCRIVSEEGYYPERQVGADYIEKYTPVVEQRLLLGGVRLAAMLNAVFK